MSKTYTLQIFPADGGTVSRLIQYEEGWYSWFGEEELYGPVEIQEQVLAEYPGSTFTLYR